MVKLFPDINFKADIGWFIVYLFLMSVEIAVDLMIIIEMSSMMHSIFLLLLIIILWKLWIVIQILFEMGESNV